MRSRHLLWCGGFLLAGLVCAQPALYLKRGPVSVAESPAFAPSAKRKSGLRSHLILQFERQPELLTVRELGRRGMQVVGYVPEHGLVVSAPDGVQLDNLGLARVSGFAPEDKLTPLAAAIGDDGAGHWIVDFHPDTASEAMREMATESGLRILEHLDLARHQLMIAARPEQLRALAAWDEVAYIYPSSRDLVEGRPVIACAGAVTPFAAIGQYVAQIGKGWPGDGKSDISVQYHFGQLSTKLPAEQARAEIERALAEWARHTRLKFIPGSSATAARTINFLSAVGAHGDPYAFDGPGRTLAHTFYPSPPNPEPLAGDVHFDDDEAWRIGADTDLYSVALHELGHALGLGHSDTPGTVMYPFYRQAETLTAEDIRALEGLYGAREPTGTGEPAIPSEPSAGEPLRLEITTPLAQSVTLAESLAVAGTLSGGTGPLRLAWSSDRGPAGLTAAAAEWRIAAVPLSFGRNVITVTAADVRGELVAKTVSVTRESAGAPQPAADSVAPVLTILSPAGANVLVSAATIAIRGTAHDNTGVTEISWSSSSGRSGVAQGTTSWVIPSLPLLVGTSTITIRAKDGAGNVGWRSLVITRR